MEDRNKPVLDQLIRKAFPQVQSYEYKITEYSLNTTFGFKFDNLAHFAEFLQQHQPVSSEELALLENVLIELNFKEDSFFYINFFEKIEGV